MKHCSHCFVLNNIYIYIYKTKSLLTTRKFLLSGHIMITQAHFFLMGENLVSPTSYKCFANIKLPSSCFVLVFFCTFNNFNLQTLWKYSKPQKLYSLHCNCNWGQYKKQKGQFPKINSTTTEKCVWFDENSAEN